MNNEPLFSSQSPEFKIIHKPGVEASKGTVRSGQKERQSLIHTQQDTGQKTGN